MILYPTETVYALGVNALNEAEIAKLFQLKGREEGKVVSWLVRDMEDVWRYAIVDEVATKIAENFLPGPLTIVLKARDFVPRHLTSSDGTVGFRISSDPIAQQLVAEFMAEYDAPLTCTSANVSGLPTLPTPTEITKQFQLHHKRDASTDWEICYDGQREGVASTVVRIVDREVTILRDGAISSYDIINIVKSV